MKQLQTLSTLAWRNLWRNYRRTLIMTSAIALGVWAMIFMTAMLRGMMADMITQGVNNLPGHIQLHHPEYRADPSIVNRFAPPGDELLEQLNQADIKSWSARVRVPAVIASERASRGVNLIGVDPAEPLPLDGNLLKDGRSLETESDRGLIMGAKLAERLETRLGKRVVLMSQDPDNNVVDRGFRVVGIFESELSATEENQVYAGRATLQKMLRMDQKISELVILTEEQRVLQPTVERLAQSAPHLEVLPWYELDRFLGTSVETFDGFSMVFIVVIFLALSFGLVNTLVMAIFERTREIGLMQALGMTPASICVQILLEAMMLLLIGLLVGNALVLLSLHSIKDGLDISGVAEGMALMGAGSVLKPALHTLDVIRANGVVLVLGIVACALPAWQASRLDPITTMNHT
jgi:ABC-type lipoprotein release transport system permease subunit